MMEQATKGAVLSGLCYPGTGQLFLGRIYLGFGIIIVSTIALVVFIYRIAIRIYRSIDPLVDMLANQSLTFQKIKLSLSQTGYPGWDLELISLIVFVFCWVASAVHAYYLGKNTERSQKSESDSRRLENKIFNNIDRKEYDNARDILRCGKRSNGIDAPFDDRE